MMSEFTNLLTVCVVHDDAKLACLGLVNLFESNNVRVIEHFEDLGLAESRGLVLVTHLLDVDFLHHGVRLHKIKSQLS